MVVRAGPHKEAMEDNKRHMEDNKGDMASNQCMVARNEVIHRPRRGIERDEAQRVDDFSACLE